MSRACQQDCTGFHQLMCIDCAHCAIAGASEVHPSAVEAAPNGDAANDHEGLEQKNGTPADGSPWSGYKHPGGLVGRKV